MQRLPLDPRTFPGPARGTLVLLQTMDHYIAGGSSAESIEGRLAQLADRQHGLISRAQAGQAGASRGLIDHRVSAGRWIVRYPGVYAIAGARASWRQSLLAACMAAGTRAVASHRAAASLRELPGGEGGLLEISAPKARRVRRKGIVVHQASSLEPVDVTVVDAIPVTTVTRTIIDLAAVIPAEAVEEALDDALRRGLTSLSRLRWRMADLGRRGRPGMGLLNELIQARIGSAATSGSSLETRFLRLLRRARLPLPTSQHELRDRGRVLARVDFAYPEIGLAIEVEGYRWHSGRSRWQHDLERRNRLTALGWRVIHVTSTDLEMNPERVVRMIADALSARGKM